MLYPSDFLSLVVPNKIFRYQYDTGQMPSILAPLTFMDHIRRFDNKHHENMEKNAPNHVHSLFTPVKWEPLN